MGLRESLYQISSCVCPDIPWSALSLDEIPSPTPPPLHLDPYESFPFSPRSPAFPCVSGCLLLLLPSPSLALLLVRSGRPLPSASSPPLIHRVYKYRCRITPISIPFSSLRCPSWILVYSGSWSIAVHSTEQSSHSHSLR